jgi:hypothetical protein
MSGTNGAFVMHGGKISGNTNSDSDGGGVYVYSGTFTMHSGEISGNKAIGGFNEGRGGGVYMGGGIFRIVNGTIYGNEASVVEPSLQNDAASWPPGAALFKQPGSTAQYGTFNGDTWSGTDLVNISYDNTIRVVNGELK